MSIPGVPGNAPGARRMTGLSRQQWASLVAPEPAAVPSDVGLAPEEVHEVYRPLARLLATEADARPEGPGPYLIGITGSVAVGKSSVAIGLRVLLEERLGVGTVTALSTDSFLYPNAELIRRGVLDRKGFPESYDQPLQHQVLTAIRAGETGVSVPVYSHQTYDILPDRVDVIDPTQIVVVEGLNVLRDDDDALRCDTVIYVDAAEVDIASWFHQRVIHLCANAPDDPDNFYRQLSTLPRPQLESLIDGVWVGVNRVNLRRHIIPTRALADIVLHKGSDHRVEEISLTDRWLSRLRAEAAQSGM